MTRYDLWHSVAPSTWPLYLSLALTITAFAPIAETCRKRLSRQGLALLAALWLVLAVLPTGQLMIRQLQDQVPVPHGPLPQARDIVVLAGAEMLDESAYAHRLEVGDAGERIIEGAALAHQLPFARLVLVGGVHLSRHMPTDVDWAAGAMERLGIAAARIHKINGTLDTCANARGLASAGVEHHPLLITSAYHMPRAIACMRAAGYNPRPWPVDYSSAADGKLWRGYEPIASMQRVDVAAHEYLGLLYYRLSGRLK